MFTKKTVFTMWAGFGAALAPLTFIASEAIAKDSDFTVAYQVSAQGLDVDTASGARKLYCRLKHAADVVCAHGVRVEFEPSAEPKAC